MKQLDVMRYYTHGKESSVEAAIRKIEELREKHPTREYVVLANARAFYNHFTVAQVRHVKIDVLEEGKDYHMPPQPRRQDYANYEDFRKDYDGWTSLRAQKRGHPEDAIKGSLNP